MNILILSQSVKDFQNFKRSCNYARHLVKKGNDVTIITAAPKYRFKAEREIRDGVKIIVNPDIGSWRLRRGSLGPIDTAQRLFQTLFDRCDIIHGDGHRPATFMPSYLGKVLKNKPYISEWMDWFGYEEIGSKRTFLEKVLLGRYDDYFQMKVRCLADGVITISDFLAEETVRLGIEGDKVLKLASGAEIDSIYPLTKGDARKDFGLGESSKIIGLVGFERRADTEDTEFVLKALSLLKREFEDVILLSASKENIPQEIIPYDVKENVVEAGYHTSSYIKYLACIDVFVLPFKNTKRNRAKWPNKMGDFMAAGRPTVSNPTGEIKALFERENVGLLAEEDEADFAEKIGFLLRDGSAREEIGVNARKVAEEQYSWDAITDKLIDFYSKFV